MPLGRRMNWRLQIKYIQTQLGELLEDKRRGLRNFRRPNEQGPQFEHQGGESHLNGSSSDED